MPKQIIYLIGAYGCGKTTAVQKIAEKRADIYPLIENDIITDFLKSDNIALRSSFYLPVYFYRIKKAIEKADKPIILVDGHPMMSFFYLQCFYEMEQGITVNITDVLDFGKKQYDLIKHCEKMLVENPQKIIHIEVPLEKHWEMVVKRFDDKRAQDFGEEGDLDYLINIRRVFNQHVRVFAEMYRAEYVKVDNLEKIEELI